MHGRAAICYAFGEPLVIDDLIVDPPQAGEVVVRIVASGVCHSDVHLIRGEWGTRFGSPPLVAGHEAAGYVVARGRGVTAVGEGDRVLVSFLRSCGRCRFCTGGAAYLCDAVFPMDATPRIRTREGRPVRPWGPGAFAELASVDQSQVVALPDDIALEHACLLGCAVITGVGAVLNTARVRAGSSVVVIGAGGVGLNVIQAARIAGAGPIIAVDTQAARQTQARLCGATHVIDASCGSARALGAPDCASAAHADDPVVAAVSAIVGPAGVDYAFVAVGVPQAVTQGFQMLGRQGTVVVVGEFAQHATITLPAEPFIFERRVIGCFMGSPDYQTDVTQLIRWHRDGRLLLEPLISGRYRLDQINWAIESLEQGRSLRNIILLP